MNDFESLTMRPTFLYEGDSPGRGKGLFTDKAIPSLTIIAVSHVRVKGLGWIRTYSGALVNHETEPTCHYVKLHDETDVLMLMTGWDLRPGDELTVAYGTITDPPKDLITHANP